MIKDSFQAGRILFSQQRALSELVGRLLTGEPLFPWYENPRNAVEVNNLAGALNYWAGQVPGDPPPPPADAIASFRARQRVSQNCAWVLLSPEEAGALQEIYGDTIKHYIQFYTVGGSGAMGLAERVDAMSHSGYSYVTYADGVATWHADIAQAADAEVAAMCAAQGRPAPPGPLP